MKLIIASNRLPVSTKEVDGQLIFTQSPGGLVQGLSASLSTILDITNSKDFYWVGWPGATIAQAQQKEVKDYLLKNLKAIPVFLSDQEMDEFYLGFCNSTLWPMFHSFTNLATFEDKHFDQYVKVNKKFAEVLSEITEEGDIVWVHDYHLMLLPYYLREKFSNIKVGFFLHIPFPTYEIYKLIPERFGKPILEGLLNADLIGFHTFMYQKNFIKTVKMFLPVEEHIGSISYKERVVKTNAFPIGIDFDKYNKAKEMPKVEENIDKFKEITLNKKVVLSIDRLDYAKGITNRLKAIERFLEKFPEFKEKVVFMVIIVPSRIGVKSYEETKDFIDSLVGKINGKFSTMGWSPIHYLFTNLPFEELSALYSIGDALLVTSIADGMNLVSKEYIATNPKGALILSKTTGAAEDLRNCFLIDPNDIEEIANTIKEALIRDEKELIEINKPMLELLKKHDIKWWTTDFLNTLNSESPKNSPQYLDKTIKDNIINLYKEAKKKALVLDYDGTLAPFRDRMTKPEDTIIDMLSTLIKNGTEISILSGRSRKDLEAFFGKLPITLVAEQGAFVKKPNQYWVYIMGYADTSFKNEVKKILDIYKDRAPEAFVEEEEYSIVFHYRGVPDEIAEPLSRELYMILTELTSNTQVDIVNISKGIIIRATGLNKGAYIYDLAKENYDFILFAGDDTIDEEAFGVANKYGISIKVGNPFNSKAKYYVNSVNEFLSFLNELATLKAPVPAEKTFFEKLKERLFKGE